MNDIDRYIRKLLVIFMILPFYLTACESERVNEADVMTSTDEDEMALTDDTVREEAIALPLDEKKTVKTGVLDATEASHLTFMREEEKLARDVYLSLAELYPDQPVFDNIATGSEQTHTDTLRDRLSQFNLPDPNPETNNLPSSLGVFTGEEWGWYFTEKFEELTSKGAVSELEALYVGAFIEELDMRDIAICPEIMIERGYPIPCGLEYTDEEALQTAYRSLISGSESHLRAYVGQIEAVIGVGNYKAQYLSQTEVDTILGR
ncbi:MAG: DUF2202 domain-containing protein [Gammaproteobacteria bacterium]|nr:DUF2202 domain-containing protein [Gammaproteobacteria bacterium]